MNRALLIRCCIISAGAVLLLLGCGCEGPKGPPGEGLSSVDLVPPDIRLIQPLPSDTITAALFTCEAEASDNDGISFVEFLIDGSSNLGGDSFATVSESPYSLTWNFMGSGHEAGLHILTARAVDLSGNMTYAPQIPLWLYPQFGQVTLIYDQTGENLAVVELPRQSGERYWNVRFSPRAECTLEKIMFEFDHWAFYDIEPGTPYLGGIDMDVLVWNSVESKPGTRLDSIRLSEEEMEYNQWLEVDFSNSDLIVSSDFHAGWSPAYEAYNEYLSPDNPRAAFMFVTINDVPFIDRSGEHRSIENVPGEGWGTIEQNYPGNKFDFHIRAVVDYGDGVAVMLAPESQIGSDQLTKRLYCKN